MISSSQPFFLNKSSAASVLVAFIFRACDMNTVLICAQLSSVSVSLPWSQHFQSTTFTGVLAPSRASQCDACRINGLSGFSAAPNTCNRGFSRRPQSQHSSSSRRAVFPPEIQIRWPCRRDRNPRTASQWLSVESHPRGKTRGTSIIEVLFVNVPSS